MIFIPTIIYCQEEYKVLSLKENTVLVNNRYIREGDIIHDKDTIRFTDENAYLKVCYKGCQKTKVISTKIANLKGSKTIVDYLTIMKNASTRKQVLTQLLQIKEFFSQDTIYICGELPVPIACESLPVNDSSFFRIRYQYQGKNIDHRLTFKNYNLILDSTIFYSKGKGQGIPDHFPISIFYYNSQNKVNTLVSNMFNPVFISKNEIYAEVKYLFQMGNLSFDDRLQIINDYLIIKYPKIEIEAKDILRFGN